MNKTWLLILSILFIGCVSETEYKKVVDENKKLKSEIHELKFGIPTLLSDAKKLNELGSFRDAREKIEILMQKYPNTKETAEAKKMLPSIEEELLWAKIKSSNILNSLDLIDDYEDKYSKGKYSKKVYGLKITALSEKDKDAYENAKSINSISALNNYLDGFPNGKYRSAARKEIASLKKANEKAAYENAKKRNTSSSWTAFLEEYPKHWDKRNIEEKIITLKVDEIMGDRNTGKLPSFSRTTYGYSSSSSVAIKNDTGYDLTVRYSGPSVREIVIPEGSTKETSLKSGAYKIAASAGGLHYAGRESLSGSYTSKYYITRSRY